VSCADPERHERLLLGCTHTGRGGVELQVSFADGCSGRLCPDCDRDLRIRHQPDLAERIAGPPAGLDALQMLRAAARAAR
jgi:hypothetical protein